MKLTVYELEKKTILNKGLNLKKKNCSYGEAANHWFVNKLFSIFNHKYLLQEFLKLKTQHLIQ